MAKKKLRKKTGKRSKGQIDQLAAPVIESAQDIWRAGLGALAMAQKESGKVVGQGSALFEHLVAEGARFEKQGKAAVDEGAANVRGGLRSVRGEIEDKLEAARQQAEDRWENLESVFERRVLKVVQGLGLATAEDLRRLADQVEKLSGSVAQETGTASDAGAEAAGGKTATRSTRRKATGKKTSKKTSRKQASSKKSGRKTGKRSSGKKTTGKKASGKKAAGKKTTGKKTTGKKTTGRKASGK